MIEPTHRYPTNLIEVLQLAGGGSVVVRPARPQDKELQRAFVRTLSDQARHFRFMTRLSELPEATAERFTSIDYRRHVAIIATIFTDSGETMIGEARYIVDEGDAAACEFAIAVTDDWQGKGLARSLLARLADHAAFSGLHRMGGDTIPSNRAMIALAKRTGFTIGRNCEDARLMHLAKDLLTNDQHANAFGRSLGKCVIAA